MRDTIDRDGDQLAVRGSRTPMGQTPLFGLALYWQYTYVTIFRNSSPQIPSGGLFWFKAMDAAHQLTDLFLFD
jgi:hypothetical protein